MARGATCPGSGKSTLHDEGLYRQCSNCHFIDFMPPPLSNPGSGKGSICPGCGGNTLREVKDLEGSHTIKRCTKCGYASFIPNGG